MIKCPIQPAYTQSDQIVNARLIFSISIKYEYRSINASTQPTTKYELCNIRNYELFVIQTSKTIVTDGMEDPFFFLCFCHFPCPYIVSNNITVVMNVIHRLYHFSLMKLEFASSHLHDEYISFWFLQYPFVRIVRLFPIQYIFNTKFTK